MVEWLAPQTDKFTGGISKYELCYIGNFSMSNCTEIGAASLQWNITELHPDVRYELKIRSAALLGYGPFSAKKYATTFESGKNCVLSSPKVTLFNFMISNKSVVVVAPSGPPTNLRVTFVNSTSLIAAWSPPELILQNGIIQNYNVCVRSIAVTSRCGNVVLPGSQGSFIASDLKPFTMYDVIVSAATSVGYGPSMIVINMTLEAGK